MKIQIGRWGNSLAVRLPKALVDRWNIKEGDLIDAQAIEQAVAETRSQDFEQRREAALQRIRETRLPLPADWKFDREDANWRPAVDRW